MKNNDLSNATRIVILGDPHLPGRLLEKKRKVIETINSWQDVDLVVSVGDVCASFGTEDEFIFARDFFSKLNKPFLTLIGNHDNFYSDSGFIAACKAERLEKIARFRRAFPNQELYFSRIVNGVKLIFLALDGIQSPLFSAASIEQLQWFAQELQAHPQLNTIVFYHAPLWTEEVLKFFAPAVNYIAQPADEFRRIVLANPQIKLWVSGHVHFAMVADLLRHRFNNYHDQVYNILNCDMDGFSVLNANLKAEFHERIWTRSLYFNQEFFRCTVFDHDLGREVPEFELNVQFSSGLVPEA